MPRGGFDPGKGYASADLAVELIEQAGDIGEPPLLLGEYGAEGVALHRRDLIGGQAMRFGHRAMDDVDQPVGAVEAAPQIIVLAIGSAEEGAEAVELEPLQRRPRPAFSNSGGVVGRDSVDLDRVE